MMRYDIEDARTHYEDAQFAQEYDEWRESCERSAWLADVMQWLDTVLVTGEQPLDADWMPY